MQRIPELSDPAPGDAPLCDPAPERVLVAGGAGFIGAALVEELSRAGVECVVVDDLSAGTGARLARLLEGRRPPTWLRLDVTRAGAWRQALREAGPVQAIVHLAARVGVRRVLAAPEACRASNVAGVSQLVAALTELPAGARPRVFAASTSEVYAEKRGALAEDDPLRAGPAQGRWAYAASKRAAEELLDAARDLWAAGRGPVHLRFFNVVGPGQDARGGMVVPTFVEHALRGRALPVHGRGEQVRTLGHVEDVARGLAAIVLRPDFPAGPLNLGGTTRASVLELARAVLRRAPGSGSLLFVDPRRRISPAFDEVGSREPDLSRARRLGLVFPERSLAELVDDCVARHAALAIGAPLRATASTGQDGGAAAQRNDARVRGGGVACASPGS